MSGLGRGIRNRLALSSSDDDIHSQHSGRHDIESNVGSGGGNNYNHNKNNNAHQDEESGVGIILNSSDSTDLTLLSSSFDKSSSGKLLLSSSSSSSTSSPNFDYTAASPTPSVASKLNKRLDSIIKDIQNKNPLSFSTQQSPTTTVSDFIGDLLTSSSNSNNINQNSDIELNQSIGNNNNNTTVFIDDGQEEKELLELEQTFILNNNIISSSSNNNINSSSGNTPIITLFEDLNNNNNNIDNNNQNNTHSTHSNSLLGSNLSTVLNRSTTPTMSINTSTQSLGSSSESSVRRQKKRSQCKSMGLVTVVLILTQLLGIYLFSIGFFPRKATLQGYNNFDNYYPSCLDNNVNVEPQYGKMVFMVVDAFRSNFIFNDIDEKDEGTTSPNELQNNNSNMNYTKWLINEGRAQPFIARATAPTVTLPRIKALLSGGIPSFIDFVQNFNSKELKDDNLLYQMNKANKTLTFFGDDTWLKLFPSYFKRFDGTTSFFVSDTVEVDNNVTRHLNEELQRDDWDMMFLHYLGLDHIGHLEGPYSDKMPAKQAEMDDIIKMINENIIERDRNELKKYHHEKKTNENITKPLPTLFIFCSDHGMNEIGNHGGSTYHETSTVLIMMGSKYYYQNTPILDHDHLHEHLDEQEQPNQPEQQQQVNNANNIKKEEENIIEKEEEKIEKEVEVHHNDNSEEEMDIEETNSNVIKEVLPKFIPHPPREVSQVDLVPTLSLLFNLPIPKNSLGQVIPELFDQFIDDEQYLRALEINCLQLIDLVKNSTIFYGKNGLPVKPSVGELMKLFEQGQEYHRSWGITPDPISSSQFYDIAVQYYIQFLNDIHDEFNALFTTFDESMLRTGILLIGASSLVTILITTFTIGISQHSGRSLDIKHSSFSFSLIIFVGGLLIVHFGLLCSSSELSNTSAFCTDDFRIGVFSIVFPALTLLIGFGVLSKTNLKIISRPTLSPLQLRKEKYLLVGGTLLHLISLFGSSMVEEEHQTWYFLTTSVILLQMTPHTLSILHYITKTNTTKQNRESFLQMLKLSSILVGLRIMRVWNQTGIQWMEESKYLKLDSSYGYIDVGRYLNSDQLLATPLLWILSVISLVAPCLYIMKILDKLKVKRGGILSQLGFMYKITIIICAFGIFSYKWNYISSSIIEPVYIARFVYLCIGFLSLIAITFPFFSKNEKMIPNSSQIQSPSWFTVTLQFLPTLLVVNLNMLFLLLHKTHNMILFTIMGVIGHYYLKYLLEDTGRRAKSGMAGVCVGLVCINWLGQFGYFALGNSNSLSTIDISGAYTGLIDYNQYAVGLLTFLIGYSAPIFFFFMSISYSSHLAINSINNNHQSEPTLSNTIGSSSDIIDELQWYSLVGGLLDCGIKCTHIFIFSVCIVIQRYHLFIWSVFSPKFLYEVLDVVFVLSKAMILILFVAYLRLLCYLRDRLITNNTLHTTVQNKHD